MHTRLFFIIFFLFSPFANAAETISAFELKLSSIILDSNHIRTPFFSVDGVDKKKYTIAFVQDKHPTRSQINDSNNVLDFASVDKQWINSSFVILNDAIDKKAKICIQDKFTPYIQGTMCGEWHSNPVIKNRIDLFDVENQNHRAELEFQLNPVILMPITSQNKNSFEQLVLMPKTIKGYNPQMGIRIESTAAGSNSLKSLGHFNFDCEDCDDETQTNFADDVYKLEGMMLISNKSQYIQVRYFDPSARRVLPKHWPQYQSGMMDWTDPSRLPQGTMIFMKRTNALVLGKPSNTVIVTYTLYGLSNISPVFWGVSLEKLLEVK